MLKYSAENKVLNVLPNDRPITAIQIIENLEKCPRGFYPISRTYDQDQDADLRESSIFKSSSARYLCFSKTEGLRDLVIVDIFVLTEKFNPPGGFSILNRTADSEQKAWKKKQLCYKLVNLKEAKVAITDIIICSRLKKAPEGFNLAGELNGVTLCFKMGNVQDTQQAPERPPRPSVNPLYPTIATDNGDYEILKPPSYPSGPSRPAPQPPVPSKVLGGATSVPNLLDGVPFVVNPRFLNSGSTDKMQLPVIKPKTMQQIMSEYNYSFNVERQT